MPLVFWNMLKIQASIHKRAPFIASWFCKRSTCWRIMYRSPFLTALQTSYWFVYNRKTKTVRIYILLIRPCICITRSTRCWISDGGPMWLLLFSSNNISVCARIFCLGGRLCLLNHAEGQVHKTRWKWRTANSWGTRDGGVWSVELLSVSVVDEGAVGEALASAAENTGSLCFVFLPYDVLVERKLISSIN